MFLVYICVLLLTHYFTLQEVFSKLRFGELFPDRSYIVKLFSEDSENRPAAATSDVGSGFQKMVDVVKQVTTGGKKKLSGEEDILVMDTKLKIIEILQVSELIT